MTEDQRLNPHCLGQKHMLLCHRLLPKASPPTPRASTAECSVSRGSKSAAQALAILAALVVCIGAAAAPTPLSVVRGAADLSVLRDYALPALRVDVGAIYNDTGKNCTIRAGGDGGWQIQPEAGHCWQTKITQGASIELWSGVGDDRTDNQPAAARGVAALGAVGGGQLVIPTTKQCWLFKSSLAVSYPNVQIVGQPGGSCIDRDFASGALIVFGLPSASIRNVGARDLTIKHSVISAAGATDLEFINAPFAHAERIDFLADFYAGLSFDGGGPYFVRDIVASADGQAAIRAGCNFGSLEPADIHVDGADIEYQHRAAFELCNVGGITISHANTDFNNHGIWAHPAAGQQVSAVYTSNSYFDFSGQEGVLADGSNGGEDGTISEWILSETTWIGSCGAAVPSYFASNVHGHIPQNPRASCLLIAASTPTAENVSDNEWSAHIFAAAGNGISILGGVNNIFKGIVTDNCQYDLSSNCSGLSVAAGVSHWSFSGNSGPATNIRDVEKQKYGVFITNGDSDYYTISGDLSGNIIRGLFDGGRGKHKLALPGVNFIQ